MNRTTRRLAATLSAAALLTAGSAASASAAPPSGTPLHPFSVVFPAGGDTQVCDFDLRVIGTGARLISTETVRNTTTTVLSGHELTFVNADDPSQKITFPSSTVTIVETLVGKDTIRRTITGGSAVLLFPSDKSRSDAQPDVPSAFVHLGETVFIDQPGTEPDTLVSAEGPSTDICAALS
jgi:hypothetical protein